MTDFAAPIAFALFAAVAVAVAGFLLRAPATLHHADLSAVAFQRQTVRARTRWLPAACRILCLSLLVVAIARPQEVSGEHFETTEGIAIQIVLDRSSSMGEPMAIDGRQTTRFDAVKHVVRDFVLGDGETFDGRRGDMIGLVAFAGFAETIAPLARQHDPLVDLTDRTPLARPRTDEDGTAIGDALMLALARLKTEEERLAREAAEAPEARREFSIASKVIILLTDGENNRGDASPAEAASLAREWGVTIYAVDVGGDRTGFRALMPDRGAATLAALADATGGRAWRAGDADAMRRVYAEIDELETTRIETSGHTHAEERFHPFALAALAALVIEVLLGTLVYRRTV